MPSIFYLISLSSLCFVLVSAQSNNITTFNFLKDPQNITSNNGFFKIGFFSPANSSNRYLGIWYKHNDSDLEVVWVANRDKPLDDSSGLLRISQLGNLELINAQNITFWSVNSTLFGGANISSVAQLKDTGNLVLVANSSGSDNPLWESFKYPTNCLLPYMKIPIDKNANDKYKLISWRNNSDPSKGRFAVGFNPQNSITEIFIWGDDDQLYWRSGPWNGNNFIGVPIMNSVLQQGYTIAKDNQGKLSLSLYLSNQKQLTHLILSYNGTLTQKEWDYGNSKWKVIWNSIESKCDIYGYCGPFGSCNSNKSPICSCLKGFVPTNKDEWNKGNWTSGCVRRTSLGCKSDGFLKLSHMKTPADATWISSEGEDECGKYCLERCQCLGYVFYEGVGCMIWNNNSFIDIQEFSFNGADFYLRLANSELGIKKKKTLLVIVGLAIGTIAFIFMFFLWRWMKRYNATNKVDSKYKSVHRRKMLKSTLSLDEFQDLPLYTFEILMTATDNFQEMNKLGRGGFGSVYKGTLEDGQEIAVKRLARTSGQGMREFMNEVLVISKLQHLNLVRLLGCCVDEDERMLVYEYMPNKSLDVILFDPLKKEHLDWKKRFNIIEGICRGLLYLHRDSRLRIIHRDLKASNILLDGELNPKISDFGMAKIFGRNEDQANTLRIVGTYGYMSPEYAMKGCFSEKSDIYSLGVLLLEIISGISINGFDDDDCLGLIGHAWKLWNEDNIFTLVDTTIFNSDFQEDILRCMQLALLCVQEYPDERPTISTVISMFRCELSTLPHPKQPGFTQRRSSLLNEFHDSGLQYPSANHVSLTSIHGR